MMLIVLYEACGEIDENQVSMNVTNTKIMCVCVICLYVYICFLLCVCFFLNSPILYFLSVMSSTISSTLLSFMNFQLCPLLPHVILGIYFILLLKEGFPLMSDYSGY